MNKNNHPHKNSWYNRNVPITGPSEQREYTEASKETTAPAFDINGNNGVYKDFQNNSIQDGVFRNEPDNKELLPNIPHRYSSQTGGSAPDTANGVIHDTRDSKPDDVLNNGFTAENSICATKAQSASKEKEADKILEEAKTEAERIKAQAKVEAQSIIEKNRRETENAKIEIANIKNDLCYQKEQLDRKQAKLDAEYNNEIARAREHANTIVSQAENRKAEIEAEAEREKQRILGGVTAQAIEDAKKGAIGALLSDIEKREREYKISLEAEAKEFGESSSELNKKMAAQASELSIIMNSSVNSCIAALSEKVREMANIQQQVTTTLDAWQRELFTKQMTPLCMCIDNLNKIIDVHNKNLIEHQSRAASSTTDMAKAEVLVSVIASLKKFNENLSRSILPGGITAFYPEKGEHFNPDFHVTENEYDYPSLYMTVEECIKPGFMKAGFGDNPQAVMLKAVVRVKKDGPTI